MSLRIDGLALYQKSLLGGLGGLLGWGLVDLIAPATGSDLFDASLKGGLVGLALGACCGTWDGLCRNRSLRKSVIGAGIGAALGVVGGLVGAAVGQGLFAATGGGLVARAFGWALFGAAIGATEGVAARSPSKLMFGSYGGFLGGLVGGSSNQWFAEWALAHFARDNALAIGGAVGLVLLGLFVGAFMGLVEDLLRSAWLVFTSGRLEGQSRTLDSRKAATSIGRSDAADICILGDPNMAQRHARIVTNGSEFFVEAVDGPVQHGTGPRLAAVTRQKLQPGDIVAFGSARATFHLGKAQA